MNHEHALQQAFEAGQFARQAARERGTCPLYGITPPDDELRKRWYAGWDQQDRLHPKPGPIKRAT